MSEYPSSDDRDRLLEQWRKLYMDGDRDAMRKLVPDLLAAGFRQEDLIEDIATIYQQLPQEDIDEICRETGDSLEATIRQMQDSVKLVFEEPQLTMHPAGEKGYQTLLCFAFTCSQSISDQPQDLPHGMKSYSAMEPGFSADVLERWITNYLETNPNLDAVVMGLTMRGVVEFLQKRYLPILRLAEKAKKAEEN